MREKFIDKAFRQDSLSVIAQANAIIDEYEAQGFTLTLRQLYYQFVARALLPNQQAEYKRLGKIVSDARLAGLIDWSAIEDRTRNLRSTTSWSDPVELVEAAAKQYKEDLWRTQNKYVEVWIEKDALTGVIEPACERWRVPYFACRGYTSQSEQYAAGQRFFRDARDFQRRTLILHLGDHDPSGIDMTRDNADRLKMFAGVKGLGSVVDVKRVALNFDQVERYNPPPNPAKDTDVRSAGYIARFGTESWELDALEPTVIDALLEAEITAVIDKKKWKAALAEEKQNGERILDAARWMQDS